MSNWKMVALVASSMFSGVAVAEQSRMFSVSIDGQPSTVHVVGKSVLVGPDGATPTYAGTIEGFQVDWQYFFVGDLEGTGNSVVAFWDRKSAMWIYGKPSIGAIAWQAFPAQHFHLEGGPILYGPTLESVSAETGDLRPLSAERAPLFPLQASERTRLGQSRFMTTWVTLHSDGRASAVTETTNGVLLAGYRGKAGVTFYDSSRIPLWTCASPAFGTTGTAWGLPSRRDAWSCSLDGERLRNARFASVFHHWAPEFDTLLRDIDKYLKIVLPWIQALVSIFGGGK